MEAKKVDKDSDDDSDLEILDVDLSIDVNKMEPSQVSYYFVHTNNIIKVVDISNPVIV